MARPPITRKNPYTPRSGQFAGITFASERQYRNALARTRGFTSWSEQQRQTRKVRSGAEVAKLRPSEREARSRALEALSRMRSEGLSLRAAAKASGTTANAVRRHAGSALERTNNGRYRAKESDRLVRGLRFPTESGVVTLNVKDSRTSSRLADYWHAVRTYLRTGNTIGLRKFRNKHIRVDKRAYRFITDPDLLDRLFDAGELSFDDIYDIMEAA
jgi:hypothetical protein